MPIDYSKWDKIELSDDSDIEVHPNVDKKSFIKWKQQSIHENRAKRNHDIANLETQISMYFNLNKRVDKLLNSVDDQSLTERDAVTKFLNANFDKTEKPQGPNVDPEIPPFNEMVEDLFEQLEGDAKKQGLNPQDGSVIRNMILGHRAKIDKVTVEAKQKLQELYKERELHISSDDIKTGFDSGFMNTKANEEAEKKAAELQKVAAANGSKSTSDVPLPKPQLQFIEYEDDVMKLAPETEEFGNLPVDNYKASEQYLLKHMQIISEQQKDALMMKAFEYQMQDEPKRSYQVIHQSELMGYVREIYNTKKVPFLHVEQMTEVIQLFFKRVIYNNVNPAGKRSFLESVQTKFDHVKNRVKIMEQEQEQEGVETIQLKSLDESTELEVNLPDFESSDPEDKKRVEAFNKLPEKMKDAIKTKDLDNVNAVFAEVPIEEAESYLDLINEAEIIGVKALLENEEDFKHLQDEYKNQSKFEDLTLQETQQEEEQATNTADTVD
ncbi:hypothetical protein ZYGR_0U02460 [Zygosaccharomyces rouxii]|uniref:Hsp90 chaperone protein kinase-targeting subunit n=1 Tax=Zygosaccharomyces rouxii TaxID=4956 RepID=A0A1Q3A486_ZYGRO|nr:hypothetical protein ZYGR_0U02460 [Zygosaccharomyces rouxii]